MNMDFLERIRVDLSHPCLSVANVPENIRHHLECLNFMENGPGSNNHGRRNGYAVICLKGGVNEFGPARLFDIPSKTSWAPL